MSSPRASRLPAMTTPTHPGRALFVSIPVADLERSTAFFTKLGFRFDPAFSGDGVARMLVGEHTSFMFGTHATFEQLSHRPMADPMKHALALFAFTVDTREEVDTVAETALAGGGTEADGPEDHGFMYARSFFDLDGHGWQVMWMNPAAGHEDAEQSAGAPA